MASRLTEANWASRRIKLKEHIAAAERAHSDAGFAREMGDGTDEAVETARAAVSTLSERIVALDAAWERTKVEVAAEQAAAEKNARAKAFADIKAKVDHRKKLGPKLVSAIDTLTALYGEYKQAGIDIVRIGSPYARPHGFRLGEAVNGVFYDPASAIAGLLRAGGLQLTGDHRPEHGLCAFINGHGDHILDHAVALVDKE